jgi:hypothetical protein
MGKRSTGEYERQPRDFYRTPLAAVEPVIPWLRFWGIRTFDEPCAGNGDLAMHLESFGLRCAYAGEITTEHAQLELLNWPPRVYQGDIADGVDALTIDHYGGADANITNLPWTRELMHPLITHLQRIAPAVLLLDADWGHTEQAIPYLKSCTDILAIGRVKWIAGTKDTGKDNAAWYRFEAGHTAGPIHHAWRTLPAVPVRAALCTRCGRSYQARRITSRFCNDACRQYAHRHPDSVTLA